MCIILLERHVVKWLLSFSDGAEGLGIKFALVR